MSSKKSKENNGLSQVPFLGRLSGRVPTLVRANVPINPTSFCSLESVLLHNYFVGGILLLDAAFRVDNFFVFFPTVSDEKLETFCNGVCLHVMCHSLAASKIFFVFSFQQCVGVVFFVFI